jgi:hypothetical protein
MIKQNADVTIWPNIQPFMQAFTEYANMKHPSDDVVITLSMESINNFEPHLLIESSTGTHSASIDRTIQNNVVPNIVVYRGKNNREANHGMHNYETDFNEYDWGQIYLTPSMFAPVTEQDYRALKHTAAVLYDFLTNEMNSEILGTIFHQSMENPDYLALVNEEQRRMNARSGRPENYGIYRLDSQGKLESMEDK